MSGITLHMKLDVRGALKNWGKRQLRALAPAFTVDGRQLRTADECREVLLDALSEGKLFLPMGECDGFDFRAGCLGHRTEPARRPSRSPHDLPHPHLHSQGAGMSADGKFESVAHHLQRTESESLRKGWADAADHIVKQRYELEALRAENVRLKERAEHAEMQVRLATGCGLVMGVVELDSNQTQELRERLFKAEAEVERLTKERDEARLGDSEARRIHALKSGDWDRERKTTMEAYDALSVRVQKLEGLLKCALEFDDAEIDCNPHACRHCWHADARAALESGTEPAPKTFTVEDQSEDGGLVADITRAIRIADKRFETSGGSSRHWVRECMLPCLNDAGLVVRRALGLGEP